VLLTDGPITFQEFAMQEQVPLASVFREVFTFLKGRTDTVVFGAQAVNAYCGVARMTQDIDIMSTRAATVAEELRAHLASHFHIAVRTRLSGKGIRIYQLRKPQNRHLVDVRPVSSLPTLKNIGGVQVVAPVDLVALKVVSADTRRNEIKGVTDRLDLHRLFEKYPSLRAPSRTVSLKLHAMGATERMLELWQELSAKRLKSNKDD
jgi:hypothetical protein